MMRVHLIGVCGTAMATVAAMLKRKGFDVRGSDQDVYPPMSDFLAAERINALSGSKRILVDLASTVDQLAVQAYPLARQFASAARRMISAA